MSWEGYDEVLCENGHNHCYDNYDFDLMTWTCPTKDCGATIAWHTIVDQTNGPDEETGLCPGEVELELATEAEYHTCSCGDRHMVKEETYKIPGRK